MTMNKCMFSSKKDDWETPQYIIDFVTAYSGWNFLIDAASTQQNMKCPLRLDDGLLYLWHNLTDNNAYWCNPPYSRHIGCWFRQARDSYIQYGALSCLLVPARIDTQAWHTYLDKAHILLLKGRIKFVGATNSAPFPSALIFFGMEPTIKLFDIEIYLRNLKEII